MLVSETKTVTREIHVAPCLECGSTDITLSDCNYSSFNQGGGKCKHCGQESKSSVSIDPSIDTLAHIWNARNDIPTLIQAEQKKIEMAGEQIALLTAKAAERGQTIPTEVGTTSPKA